MPSSGRQATDIPHSGPSGTRISYDLEEELSSSSGHPYLGEALIPIINKIQDIFNEVLWGGGSSAAKAYLPPSPAPFPSSRLIPPREASPDLFPQPTGLLHCILHGAAAGGSGGQPEQRQIECPRGPGGQRLPPARSRHLHPQTARPPDGAPPPNPTRFPPCCFFLSGQGLASACEIPRCLTAQVKSPSNGSNASSEWGEFLHLPGALPSPYPSEKPQPLTPLLHHQASAFTTLRGSGPRSSRRRTESSVRIGASQISPSG